MNVYFFFFFSFYEEIQDGCQNWRENNFRKKSPLDPAHTPQVKHFNEIALSRTVSEINAFSCLQRYSRWPPRMAGQRFF